MNTSEKAWMNRNLLWCSTMLVAVAGVAANAQPVTGPYVSIGGGGNLLQDERTKLDDNFPAGRFQYDIGAAGVAAAGYGFGNGFRVEVEGDYRFNALRQFEGTSFPTAAGGHQTNYGGMVNALFDMDIRTPFVYPYFGAGVGYMETRWKHFDEVGTSTAYDFAASGNHGDFAYQGIFGLAFPMPFLPGLSATAEYRYMSITGNGEYNASSVGTEGASGPKAFGTANGKIGITSNNNHSALIGLRYQIFPPAEPPAPAAAPPPPPAAPAPTPSRTYLVFFDWDRADLTVRARQIVAEAATASTHVQTTRIEVNGYTDLSGTAAYNQRLSVRRAESVEAELVKDGVSKSEISIHGYGETNPLVPTAKGVREPQNRRVEIILK
jgi:outer membrane protein OmpA-like peptidoglycan-associated protein